MKNFIILFIFFSFLVNSLYAQMAIWEDENSGTINGVKFKLSNLDEEENIMYKWDFSNPQHFRYPLKKGETYCALAGSDNWHLKFSSKVQNLHFYIGVWRPGIYKFSESFRLISGSDNIRKIDDYIIIDKTDKESFGNAIIVFDFPICCLYLESSRKDNGPQIITFGLYDVYYCGRSIMISKTRKSLADRMKCSKTAKLYPKRTDID